MKSLKIVEEKLINHSEKVMQTIKEFKIGIIRYMQTGLDGEVENYFKKVHKLEDAADNIRRDTIREILEGDLLNSTSIDFLRLTENLDKIADKSEKIIDKILENKINKEAIDIKIIEEMLEITVSQMRKLQMALKDIFIDFDKAYKMAKSLEDDEERIDDLERKCINKLRKMDIDLSKKVYYRNFINMIANISDKIEDTGDEIEKISIIRGM